MFFVSFSITILALRTGEGDFERECERESWRERERGCEGERVR